MNVVAAVDLIAYSCHPFGPAGSNNRPLWTAVDFRSSIRVIGYARHIHQMSEFDMSYHLVFDPVNRGIENLSCELPPVSSIPPQPSSLETTREASRLGAEVKNERQKPKRYDIRKRNAERMAPCSGESALARRSTSDITVLTIASRVS